MHTDLLIGAVVLSALLVGCNRSDSWKASNIQSGSNQFSSSRLIFHTKDKINGLDVEFLSMPTACNVYIIVHSHPIKGYQGDLKKAFLTLETKEEKRNFLVIRHEGGHKVLLTHEARDYLIQNLLSGQDIKVSTSGYSSDLPSQSFDKKYILLETPPRYNFKIHTPLDRRA